MQENTAMIVDQEPGGMVATRVAARVHETDSNMYQ